MDFSDKYPYSYIDKMMYEMENSPVQKCLRDYENSIEMRMLKENPQLEKTLEWLGWIDELKNSSLSRIHEQFNNSASKYIEDIKKLSGFDKHFGPNNIHLSSMMNQLRDSSILDAISEFDNLPFQNERELSRFLQNQDEHFNYDFIVEDDDGFSFDPDVLEEIENEKTNKKDFNSLSKKAQGFIVIVFWVVVLPIIQNVVSGLLAKNIEEWLQNVNNKTEIQQILNDPPIEINTSLLADYCVITSENLKLRAEPTIESKILTQVSIGKIFEVLEKTNDDWLKIETEPVDPSDEIIAGWILKKHTTLFCELDVKNSHE